MAIIKCKMCGGDLKLIEGSSVCECEYCGTRQTVPSADNEKKMTLFSRASRLLRSCEFDKASGVFETIVADFPEEAEAYWGLVLCKYGIEYVDDPATGKKVPTCHRSSFDNVLDDSNFEQAYENADAVARRVYRDEARAIEELRKGIIEVSGKEEPYDIFISYKETDENGERTLDSVIAQDIYSELTDEGYRVFFSRISLESKLGTEYEPYIFAALNSAKVMIVVGTDYENFDAVWVKNEWSRFLKLIASGQKKTLIPVFKNMDAYDMPKEFAKLSAQDIGKVGAMQDLLRGVDKILQNKKDKAQITVQSPPSPNIISLLDRGTMALEDGEWDQAIAFFDQVLNMDSRCAAAYLGTAMAEYHTTSKQSFEKKYIEDKALFANNRYITRAKQFADNELASWFNKIEALSLEKEKELSMKKNEYQSVIDQFNKARTIEQYEMLKQTFLILKDEGFTDAYFYIRKCETAIFNLEAKEAKDRKIKQNEDRFHLAERQIQEAKSIDQFQKLKQIFVLLKDEGFSDAYYYIRKCETSIAEIEAKERREKAKIEKEHAEEETFQQTKALFDAATSIEHFKQAKVLFEELADKDITNDVMFSECYRYISKCNEAILNILSEEYEKASISMEKTHSASELRSLAEVFMSLKDFKDSSEKGKTCISQAEKIERNQERKNSLLQEREMLLSERNTLKGFFSSRRRKEIGIRMATIDNELEKLALQG